MTTWNDNDVTIDLTGKIIVVTGGSRGMGLAMVKGAHAAGATVMVVARDEDRLDSIVGEAASFGATIFGIPADIADDAQRDSAFQRIVSEHGRIDGLVNNAGITKVAPSINYDIADLRRILEVNVTAVFGCSQAAAQAMPNGGAIVNTASLSSFIGQPERAAYVASKTAVLGLTRALAVEWGPLGIRVNSIAPGYIETDLTGDLLRRGVLDRDVVAGRTPLRRFGAPDDVVGATLFLLSDLSTFVTGATLSIDGGWLANGYIR
ncbi:SDR family NAD(P)-dependent oxidoreductase [Paramicrobacterium chengjingii]|uniref:SDR family NAD(P)-dependent oxidoreductase n=1 Tax=Paramicrobacterium chengjingii TaxID=2769067 RepID=UPI0014243A09|nr:glucose 1-dehydrogenase [Microbacterium chengjingii]